jgi:hypothetical protein
LTFWPSSVISRTPSRVLDLVHDVAHLLADFGASTMAMQNV